MVVLGSFGCGMWHVAKRQVRGVKESPEMGVCCLSNRLNMFDSAIESLTRVDSNALFRF